MVCQYCGSEVTPNLDLQLQALSGTPACSWDHHIHRLPPHRGPLSCYAPSSGIDPYNQSMRYPPRYPGAPGNAGENPK